MNTYDHKASINIKKHLIATIASVIYTITKIYTVPPNTNLSVCGDTKTWIF